MIAWAYCKGETTVDRILWAALLVLAFGAGVGLGWRVVDVLLLIYRG